MAVAQYKFSTRRRHRNSDGVVLVVFNKFYKCDFIGMIINYFHKTPENSCVMIHYSELQSIFFVEKTSVIKDLIA